MLKLNNKLVNNQLAETNLYPNFIIKILIAGIVIALSIFSLFWFVPSQDPYVEQVLSYNGDAVRGEAIFQVNCASCHGINATGNVGPSLLAVSKHKSEVQIIQQVVSGKTPPMPKFQPSEQDMADLLSYLKQIS
jgi:mono/diheme cytochrome c family protein